MASPDGSDKHYYVGRNYCSCQAETCNCPDYAIYYGLENPYLAVSDDKHSTHFKEEIAKEFCDLLNEKGCGSL